MSIIVVSYNTAHHLRRCLASIREFPPSCPFEVLVVDNASPDGSADMVWREFPAVRLLRRPVNDGYGVALNGGVAETTGALLMFLNPDVEVRDGSLDHLCRFAADHRRAGVVGPRLELADGSPQPSARHFCSPWRLALEASRLPHAFPPSLRQRVLLGTYFDQSETRDVPWISGACHLVPRSVWDEVGVLTEDTFCGFDDYDYCFRVRANGYQVWIDAESSMTHHCSVAVRDRWSSWEVEQVAIHNTYVVLESHWPWWRVKALLAAELVSYGIEWIRVSRTTGDRAADGQWAEGAERLRHRLALLGSLFTGRQRPIRRFDIDPGSRSPPASAGTPKPPSLPGVH